jgi:putative glutamine amidotransferase
MKNRPLIGLSMRLELETNRFYLGRDYSEALEGLGAVPVHLGLIPNDGYVSEMLARLDGILLPGSDTDVNPLIYGEEPHPQLKKIVPEKDDTDLALLAAAETLGKPVFAICYGMQALNVARGGTLYQDLGAQFAESVKHEQGQPLARASHTLKIEPRSRLAELAGALATQVNSHHHQAVREVGDNLRATAW